MKTSSNLIRVLLLSVLLVSHSSYAEEAATSASPEATPSATPSSTPSAEVTPTPVPEIKEEKKAEVVADPQSEKDQDKLYGNKKRLLGDFQLGPFVTGVAIPRPVSFGIEMKWKDVLGVSAGYGFFPQLTFDQVKMKISAMDFRLRVYPFKGSFSIGLGIGSQKFTGETTQLISPSPTETNIVLTQDNFYAAPQLGWNWVWDSGFFMGMDLGVQLSLSRKTALTTNADNLIKATDEYKNLEKDVNDMADLIGKIPLPLLTLIKIGYFF